MCKTDLEEKTLLRLLPVLLLLFAVSVLAAPPVAPVRPVSETYFGQTLVDPYRWMEDVNSDREFQAWLGGQNDSARTLLAALPERDKLRAEIGKLDNAGVSVSSVQEAGGRWFYLKSRPGDPVPRLFTRTGFRGAERLLLDPDTFAAHGTHTALDYFTPSWDGTKIAYGISAGGSENSVLRIRAVATGRDTSETIDRAEYGGITWTLDSKAFYFVRLQKTSPNSSPGAKYEHSTTFLHRVGTLPETDTAILGAGLNPAVPLLPSDVPTVQVTPASPYAFAVILHGARHEWTIYCAPAARLDGPHTPWVKLCGETDGVTAFDAHGSTAYLLTHKNASRFEVVAVNFAKPDFAHARVVIPASKAVLSGLGTAADALYVTQSAGGLGQIRRVPFDGGPVSILPQPFPGAISGYYFSVSPRRPGVVYRQTGWTHASVWLAYDPQTRRVSDTKLKPPLPVSFADIRAREVFAPGLDGTLVPLSIIYKQNLKLDGTHPTLLAGYGAYGYSPYSPYLDPTWRAWLDRGGVLAFAHIRGGDEYGEDWHKAGQKLTKHNTWEDFIACGQYLIAQKYTSPAHLAGEGASAGGITIGRALTARPDLWGAMVGHACSFNQLRAELSPNGPPNIPEFGTFTDPDGFNGLYAMDAYSHIKTGVRYPAVLLTTGINDPRVSPWQPAKFAARLQAATPSGKPVLLRVDYDAGHGNGSTKAQRDDELADEYAFLLSQLRGRKTK